MEHLPRGEIERRGLGPASPPSQSRSRFARLAPIPGLSDVGRHTQLEISSTSPRRPQTSTATSPVSPYHPRTTSSRPLGHSSSSLVGRSLDGPFEGNGGFRHADQNLPPSKRFQRYSPPTYPSHTVTQRDQTLIMRASDPTLNTYLASPRARFSTPTQDEQDAADSLLAMSASPRDSMYYGRNAGGRSTVNSSAHGSPTRSTEALYMPHSSHYALMAEISGPSVGQDSPIHGLPEPGHHSVSANRPLEDITIEQTRPNVDKFFEQMREYNTGQGNGPDSPSPPSDDIKDDYHSHKSKRSKESDAVDEEH